MNTPSHEDKARFLISCVPTIFAHNLLFAFIGGSRAAGTSKWRSDIDVFVAIKSPDYFQEARFARLMRRTHREMKLSFDHYGEIIDIATLDALLALSEATLQENPWMTSSPCYRGNCVLSYFRKGLVLQNFLAGPKILCCDPAGIITGYANRAINLLKGLSSKFPDSSGRIRNLPATQKAAVDFIEESWARYDGLDTPVGVSLWTWFDSKVGAVERSVLSKTPEFGSERMMACPLAGHDTVGVPSVEVPRRQCAAEYVDITEKIIQKGELHEQ